jgi:hypothetical protein
VFRELVRVFRWRGILETSAVATVREIAAVERFKNPTSAGCRG